MKANDEGLRTTAPGVGAGVGVGATVGAAVGAIVGATVGIIVGLTVGVTVGRLLGTADGFEEDTGTAVGANRGDRGSSTFPPPLQAAKGNVKETRTKAPLKGAGM